MVKPRTPLDVCKTPLTGDGSGEASGALRISHEPVGTLMQVSGWAPDFEAVIAPTLEGLGLSGLGEFNQAQVGTHCICFRTAPNRLLIWQKESGDVLAQLEAVDSAVSPILELSHGRVRITVEGSQAQDLMTRLSTIDFRDRAFSDLAFAQTEIHHTSCMIFRPQSGTYELLIPTSYAHSLWEFILDVARPFGLSKDATDS